LFALTVGAYRAGAADAPAQTYTPTAAPSATTDPAAATTSAAQPLASPTPLPQATPSPPAARKLSPIVVTATRMDQPLAEVGTTVTVVDDKQIESQKIRELGTILRQVPGVEVTQTGSPGTVTNVSIRGSSSSQTLILIDGVEINTGATGAFDIANLTTDDLDRIEVVRGAGGSLYGSQAIGGVINLITREGEGAPKFSLLSEGGNAGTERQRGTVSGSYGKLGYSGAISYYSTNGFRPVNDGSDNLAGALRLDYHPCDDTTIRGFARYTRSNVGLVNFSIFSGIALDPTAHQRGEFMLFKGEIEHWFSTRMLGRASAYFVRNDIRINQTTFPGSMATEVDRIPDETRGGNLEVLFKWGPGIRTLAGFDFKDRWVRSFSALGFEGFPPFVSLFRARRQEYAGYVEQEATMLDGRLIATGGVRVDGNSQFGIAVSPAWAIAIPIDEWGLTLRGNYSEGFRAPTFNELFFPFFGNPALEPEISSEWDGGFTKVFGEWGSFTATYFSRRVHNLIVAVPCPSCPFGSQAGNAGRVDTQGVEVVPSVTPLPGLTISGFFTFLDQISPGTNPLRVPKKSASGLAQYVREELINRGDRLTLSLNYTFVGDRADISPASGVRNNPAYHRFDAVMSYAGGIKFNRIRSEEVFVRINNLTDRDYDEALGFRAPSINFVAGVKVDF
jgi:vitamin B12 transporter